MWLDYDPRRERARGDQRFMQEYVLALGANLGDREYYIGQAIEAIRTSCGPIQRQSRLLETEAMGAADRPFLNGALVIQSTLEPESLLTRLLAIEQSLGRTRTLRWGNRTIDLDIILWKDAHGNFPSVKTPTLTIPHPEMHKRLFVLGPVAEVAGDWRHAELQETVAELLKEKQKSG
ncbi:2-amino-4-hydroxy-6-hydroxymethyldihydropteridine diphosphokinase [Oligoflexus tunisiensis]|uniref:2-amino-4-hydroxy-6- hydroxymethyldihydropteridine diphosphokinase n=1 Tax=Oligoflexus tunisiensis TaxID=708132 RepID=UPI001C408113|nr:2-amino-4-hydroxy-6-hydroxymethyldihydropteridine diphosphokinase [Oligoflexus tunisiensis]